MSTLYGNFARPLERLASTDRSLSRQVRETFALVREYGPEEVSAAVAKAHVARAFGADSIANILRQQQQRREVQPPLRFEDPALNELAHRSSFARPIQRFHSSSQEGVP